MSNKLFFLGVVNKKTDLHLFPTYPIALDQWVYIKYKYDYNSPAVKGHIFKIVENIRLLHRGIWLINYSSVALLIKNWSPFVSNISNSIRSMSVHKIDLRLK